MSARSKLLDSRAVGVRRTEALCDSLAQEQDHAEALRRSLEQEQDHAESLRRSIEQERQNAEVLRRSLEHGRAALTAASAELGLARRHVEELLDSASWRVTAPLRFFAGHLGRAVSRCREAVPIYRWIRSGVLAAIGRFPSVFRQAGKLLNYTPQLREWLIRWLGMGPPVPVELSETNSLSVFARKSGVVKLSARGKAIYNQLAKDLEMQELPEAPGSAGERANDRS